MLTTGTPAGGKICLEFTPDQQFEVPFSDLLTAAATGENGLGPSTADVIRVLAGPALLTLLVTRWCASSAKVFSVLSRFALEKPGLDLRVVDVEATRALELPPGVTSVPVLVVGGQGRFYGEGGELELARAVVELASERWEPFTVGHMLDRRLRGELLELLRARALSAACLAAFVGSESFSRRTAAIVSLMDLAQADRVLPEEALPVLQQFLEAPSAQVRGDALFALAEIGDLRTVPAIEALASDPDPDVREGAEEAIEKIKKRTVWGWLV